MSGPVHTFWSSTVSSSGKANLLVIALEHQRSVRILSSLSTLGLILGVPHISSTSNDRVHQAAAIRSNLQQTPAAALVQRGVRQWLQLPFR